mgnify:CR=1 FL=1
MNHADNGKQAAALAALRYLEDGMVIGVGTGSTVNHFIDALAPWRDRLKGAVSSSESSTTRLRSIGIEVIDLNRTGDLELYVDGADETDRHRRLIKGGGGALTREKIVAAASRRFVCIVDESKVVDVLGRFPLPVEVIPMARSYVSRQMVKLGGQPLWRENVVTDNGNWILDVHGWSITDPVKLESDLNAIVGSLIQSLLGTAIGTPIGMLVGTYLAEYAKDSWLGNAVRFVSDILLSAPSILIGLFVYQILVLPFGGFSGWAGVAALAIIVIPIVVRTTEDMLQLIPNTLREAVMGLGAPKWKMITLICWRSAMAGIVNSIAGGGTLLTFPALTLVLGPSASAAVIANATSTIAVFPGSVASTWGYRRELAGMKAWILPLSISSSNI